MAPKIMKSKEIRMGHPLTLSARRFVERLNPPVRNGQKGASPKDEGRSYGGKTARAMDRRGDALDMAPLRRRLERILKTDLEFDHELDRVRTGEAFVPRSVCCSVTPVTTDGKVTLTSAW